jgi:TfoX/Sxy family transcriptional regulator of competence genes
MYDESLADRVRNLLAAAPFTERKMFGGLAFLIGGNMACGIVRDELMVRTGPDAYEEALQQPHARPMEFIGRPMRGMVFVAVPGLEDDALSEWVGMGATCAASLPPSARTPGIRGPVSHDPGR